MSDFEQLQAQDVIYALAVTDGVFFAGRASGLYRSDDGGHSWHNAYETLNIELPLATTALAFHGQNVFAGVKGGILRSGDGGHTWFTAALQGPPPLVVALAISPNFIEDGILLAGTAEDGVYSSTDRGSHWTPWNFGLIDLNIFSMAISPDFTQDQMVFVGTESGIFRSKNGGRAWRALPFPPEAAPVLSLGVSRDFASDNCLYAGTEANGLYVSTDRGQSWQASHLPENSSAVNAIAVSGDSLWILTEDQVIKTRSQDQSWSTIMTFPGQNGVALCVDQPALLVGLAAGKILVHEIRAAQD
jgi:photosystem II stability/assembly factor-like uncharacterized protein